MHPPAHGTGPGARSRSYDDWVDLAVHRVRGIIDTELAAPPVQIYATLEEGFILPGHGRTTIDAHIATKAIRRLEADGEIRKQKHLTKGQRPVEVWQTANHHLRKTALDRNTRRKAMLTQRFQGPIAATAGKAGEAVVRRSFTELPPESPYTPFVPGYAEVAQIGTVKFRGALDSAAYLHRAAPDGFLNPSALLAVEVKNRRLVIYPPHKEIHQLLSKCALLQTANPAREVLPFLVCRRAHWWAFNMAKDMGFLIHETKKQYVTPTKTTPLAKIHEVQSELHLYDLHIIEPRTDPPLFRQVLTETIPKRANEEQFRRWKLSAEIGKDTFDRLRKENNEPREDLILRLRDILVPRLQSDGLGCNGEWART